MTTETALITGTDFITVATKDLDTAMEFYGGVLGLPESKRWGHMPGVEFETGNLTIAVMQSDAFGLEFRANNHPIELHVDDFDAARAELESRGITFKGTRSTPASATRRSSRIRTATRWRSTTATRLLTTGPTPREH
jgi:catechol 2,3-dioxygenase-like lactoylglutathione lyase family enzyme